MRWRLNTAVISDIHGNEPALTAILSELSDSTNLLVCGDIIGHLGWPEECVEMVWNRADEVVRGNHDCRIRSDYVFSPSYAFERDEHRVVTEGLSEVSVGWLNGLEKRVETSQYIMAHSWPKEFRDKECSVDGFQAGDMGVTPRLATKAGTAANGKMVFVGHTHEQHSLELEKFAGQSGLLLNPGAVGCPYDQPAEYAMVDLETQDFEFREVEYDYGEVEERCEELGVEANREKNV